MLSDRTDRDTWPAGCDQAERLHTEGEALRLRWLRARTEADRDELTRQLARHMATTAAHWAYLAALTYPAFPPPDDPAGDGPLWP